MLLCCCVDHSLVFFLLRSSLPNSKFDLLLAVASNSGHVDKVVANKTLKISNNQGTMLVEAKLYVFCEYEMNESIMVAEYSRENHSANQITAQHISAAVILLRSAMNCKKAAEFDAILFQES